MLEGWHTTEALNNEETNIIILLRKKSTKETYLHLVAPRKYRSMYNCRRVHGTGFNCSALKNAVLSHFKTGSKPHFFLRTIKTT